MYTNTAENKLKLFNPVILFHDHQHVDPEQGSLVHKRIHYGDSHYSPLIEQKKREVADMLHKNGRKWSELRSTIGHDSYHDSYRERIQLPSLSPSNSSRTTSSSPALTYCGLPSPPLSQAPPSPPDVTNVTLAVTVAVAGNANANASKNGKRRRGNLPKAVTLILREWLVQHKKHPYPTEEEKLALARETKLTMNQISNWFINARRRILQPMLSGKQDGNDSKTELDIYPYEASEHSDSNSDDYMRKPLKRSSSKAGLSSPGKVAKKPYSRRPRAPIVIA